MPVSTINSHLLFSLPPSSPLRMGWRVRLCIQDPLDPGVSYLLETLRPILVGISHLNEEHQCLISPTTFCRFSFHMVRSLMESCCCHMDLCRKRVPTQVIQLSCHCHFRNMTNVIRRSWKLWGSTDFQRKYLIEQWSHLQSLFFFLSFFFSFFLYSLYS